MTSNLVTEKLQVSQDHIEELFIKGVLSADLYYECLVTLAANHAKEHDIEKALIFLNRCPPDYFDTAMVEQMSKDENFAALAAELVHRLVRNGVLPDFMEDVNMPTSEYSN